MDKKFMDYIKENIKEYLPEDFGDASVEIEETLKTNNLIRQGLLICRKGESISPMIYLESYEKRYNNGEEMEQILREIAELRLQLGCENQNILSELMDYGTLKQNLTFSMCDPELNQGQLKCYVHTNRGKYMAMYRVIIGMNEHGTASMLVTENHLKIWKITEEQLYEDTIKAEKTRGFELFRMDELTDRINHSEDSFTVTNLLKSSDKEIRDYMYVLTNHSRNFGAGAIMHDDLLEEVGNIIGCDYFILPSSIHELVLVPDVANHSQKELEEKVSEINETEVEPEDIFSYYASFYDNEQKILYPEKPIEKRYEVQEGTETSRKLLPVLD